MITTITKATDTNDSTNEKVFLVLIIFCGFLYIVLGTFQIFPVLQLVVKPLPIWILIIYIWLSFRSFYNQHNNLIKLEKQTAFPYHVVYNRILLTLGLLSSSAGDVFLNLHDVDALISPVLWIKHNVNEAIFFIMGIFSFLVAHIMYTISFSIEGRHKIVKKRISFVEATLRFLPGGSLARSLILLAPVAIYMSLLYWAILNIGSLPDLLRIPVLFYVVVLSIFAWRVFLRFNQTTLGTHNEVRPVDKKSRVRRSIEAIKYGINHYQIVRIVGALLFIASDSAIAINVFKILHLPRIHATLFIMTSYYASQVCLAYSVTEYVQEWLDSIKMIPNKIAMN